MSHLSKSDFLLYLDSPMHLFAKKNGYIDLKVPSLFDLFSMKQGQEIEKIAEKFLLEKFKNEETYIQQTYKMEHFLARPDFVVKNPITELYDIYEIKSSSSVKNEHKYDITFQYLVCSISIPIGNSYIVHINKEFVKSGPISFSKFFQITNVNEIIEEYKTDVQSRMTEALEITYLDDPNLIEGCLKPKVCISLDLCHPNLPVHPIYEISRVGKKAQLLKDQGILAIKDIPSDFKLSKRQSIQVKAVKEDKVQLDEKGIQEILEGLDYPLYFLDYETFNPAIPFFDGYSPYQHITFQFSLHILPAKGQSVQHVEYVHDEFNDPVKEIVSQLKQNIGESGSIVVWNKSFEKGRNADMADFFPEEKEFLEDLNERLFDLMDIFSKGHYVHKDFLGSASLKNVLPVLVSDLTYEGLNIANGEQAMLAWPDLIDPEYPEEEKVQLKKDMLAYCKLDTLAMVEILQRIKEIISV